MRKSHSTELNGPVTALRLGQSPKQVNRSVGDWNHVIRQSSSQIEAVNLAGVLSAALLSSSSIGSMRSINGSFLFMIERPCEERRGAHANRIFHARRAEL